MEASRVQSVSDRCLPSPLPGPEPWRLGNQRKSGINPNVKIGPTVARIRAWLDAGGITGEPMFQRLDKPGRPRGRLSTVSVRAIIQRRAAEAGIEGRVSGHSLRVGGAQSLAAAGASIVEMQNAGGG